MTRSSVFFFTVSLLVLLVASSATTSSKNVTSGLRYDGCAPGDTVGECMIAAVEEEGVEAVVGRVMQQRGGRYLSYRSVQRPAICNIRKYGDCIGKANNRKPCTDYQRCKRAT